MKITITTPDNKKYTLSESLYAIDGTWLFEDNELTGRINLALLKDCEIDFDFDLDKYLYSQAEKILPDSDTDENVKITRRLEKYFKTKVIIKALADVVFDKNNKK